MNITIPSTSRMVFQQNKFLRLVPEFEKLLPKVMYAIMLYADPCSPLMMEKSRLSDRKFRELCCKKAKMIKGAELIRWRELFEMKRSQVVENAILAYEFMRPGGAEYQSLLKMHANIRKLQESGEASDLKAFVAINKVWPYDRIRDELNSMRNGFQGRKKITPKLAENTEKMTESDAEGEEMEDWDPNNM